MHRCYGDHVNLRGTSGAATISATIVVFGILNVFYGTVLRFAAMAGALWERVFCLPRAVRLLHRRLLLLLLLPGASQAQAFEVSVVALDVDGAFLVNRELLCIADIRDIRFLASMHLGRWFGGSGGGSSSRSSSSHYLNGTIAPVAT